ncbi:hypothetical protein Tco_0444737, partial [Tanacetum coccineum]
MAISVISVSSDSSEESVGTSTGRVILFGTIPTTIPDTTPSVIPPTTHIDTTPIPTVSPTIPPSPDYTPASPDYSPASDTEFDPSEDPSSDHIPPLPATSPFLSSTDDSSDSDIPDTPPSPTYEDLSDFASSRSSYDHSLPAPSSGMRPSHHLCSLVPSVHHSSAAISDRPSHDSFSMSPSRKRSRSLAAFVPLSSPIPRALSSTHADLLPSPKRIRSPESATDLEVSLVEDSEPSRYRGAELEMDDDVDRSYGIDIDPEIQAEIDKCIAYADDLRDRGINSRVVVEAVGQEEIEMGARGPIEEERAVEVTYETLGDLVQRFHDHTEEILVHCVQAIESVQRDQGHRIVATGQQSTDMLERIRELEQDNRRLKDMMDVASQRVTRTILNTRSGASRTREGINQQIDRRLAGALGARDAARNLEPLIGGGGKQEEISGNGGNGGNGNGGNGNGGGNGYNFEGFMPARECTYQDFLKCQPLSFNRTKGVVGLTRWFEKMETVFHISNCLEKYQVKYATCTLLNSALTSWNSHKRTIRIEVAYAISWAELMKLMTEELVLLCTIMVPSEEDKVDRFVGGFPDNIKGNIIAAEPTNLQDAIRIANNLMDQKLKEYARSAENKRRLENNPRDTRGQQPVFKRQNIGGHIVARAYTARNNEKKGYVGSLPYCNKCKLHHAGPCTIRCGN